jgi:hypothetical protein
MRNHCCEAMRTHLQTILEPSQEPVTDRPVLYDAVFDEYRLVTADQVADRTAIGWCPFCGTRLPPSKRDLWFAELDRLGLTPDDPALPANLRTDGWWERSPG